MYVLFMYYGLFLEYKYVCSKCAKKYKKKMSLYHHLRNYCGKEKTYACPFKNCTYKAHTSYNVKRHVVTVHSGVSN